MNQYPLDHIGILMTSKERAYSFCEKFGLKIDSCEYVDVYQSDCMRLQHRETETPIELIIPHGGILQHFNNGKGGIHHIAFAVEDIEKARLEYEDRGLMMLEEQAVQGVRYALVNFIRPSFGEGILVEFVQSASNDNADQ